MLSMLVELLRRVLRVYGEVASVEDALSGWV